MQIGVDKLDIKENITNYLINDSLDEDTQSFMFFVTKLFKLDEDDEDNGSGGFTMDDLLKMIKFLYEKKGITNFKNLVKMANFKQIFPNNPKNATKLLNNVMGLMAKSNFNLAEYDKLCNQKLNKGIKGGGNLIDNLFERIKARVNLFKINKTKMGVNVSKLEIKSLKDRVVKAFKLAEKVLKFAKKITTKFVSLKKSNKLETSKEEVKGRGGDRGSTREGESIRKGGKGESKERGDIQKGSKGEGKENKEFGENRGNREDKGIKGKIEENKTEEKIRENKETIINTENNRKSEPILNNNTNNQRTSFDRELTDFINNKDASKFSNYETTSSKVRDDINRSANLTNEKNNGLSQNNEKENSNIINEHKEKDENIKTNNTNIKQTENNEQKTKNSEQLAENEKKVSEQKNNEGQENQQNNEFNDLENEFKKDINENTTETENWQSPGIDLSDREIIPSSHSGKENNSNKKTTGFTSIPQM